MEIDKDGQKPAAFDEIEQWLRQVVGDGPFLLGIGGPGGCGKTRLSHWLHRRIEETAILALDDFRLPRDQRSAGIFGSHPEGNDLERLRACLAAARRGEPFERPVFDRVSGRWESTETVPSCRLLICDGEIAAHSGLRAEFDGLVLVEAHWRTQLNTRLTRDMRERGCSLEKAIEIFLQSNLRDYAAFAEGASAAADFVLYRNRTGAFSSKKRPETNEPGG